MNFRRLGRLPLAARRQHPRATHPSALICAGMMVAWVGGCRAPLNDAGLDEGSLAAIDEDTAPSMEGGERTLAQRKKPGSKPPSIPKLGEYGAPLGGLTAAQQQDFTDGLEEFLNEETAEGGLGPIFNHTGCFKCHSAPAIGGASAINVTRFGAVKNGVFDSLDSLGGSLLQVSAIDPKAQEVVPPEATLVAFRQSTPLFGLGLIEAIEDSTIIDGVKRATLFPVQGKVAMVQDVVSDTSRVGRFGWKAQQATLLAFSGDAYVNEMGVTSRFFVAENAPNGKQSVLAQFDTVADPEDQVDLATGKADIDHAADFMRLLAPPPSKLPKMAEEVAGSALFQSSGCADCHTPSMKTGKNVIAALSLKEVRLFSDLLLHDMGNLGDGIVQGPAAGSQMKTAPLWGLKTSAPYLHDGREPTVDLAVRAHAGQAKASRDRYVKLIATERAALLKFLDTL